MVSLFPLPSAENKQPLGFCSNSEEQFMNLESVGNKETIDSIDTSLENNHIKVNSNLKEEDGYSLVDELLELLFSNCLSDMEYRLISCLRLADTLFEGIPMNSSLLARRFRKSRTTIIAATKSLVDRNIIEKIKPSKGQDFLYRLLPMDGWQERETVTRKVQTNVDDVKSNVIDFPNRNVAEDEGYDPWFDEEKVEPVPTIWRSPEDSDSVRYWTTGQIYDDASGIEVVRQCEAEGLIPQQVVKRAIAFSKVPQLILGTITSIAEKLITFIDKLGEEVEKQEAKPAPRKKVIPPVQKLNTQASQGSRYGQSVNQGHQVNRELQQKKDWFNNKYKEGYFREDWDEMIKRYRGELKTLVWTIDKFNRKDIFGNRLVSAYGACINTLYQEWDKEIIPFMWGFDIREGVKTVEDYLEWKDGKQNQ